MQPLSAEAAAPRTPPGAVAHPAALALGAILTCLVAGAMAARAPVPAVLLAGLLLLVASLRLPPAAWVAGSLALVLLIRVPISAGLLPDAAVQLPIVTAWLALIIALMRRDHARSGPTNVFTALLLLLAVACVAAALGAGTSVARPLYYLTLLGMPFALIGALLLEPPTPLWRRRLIGTLVGLIVVQVPVTLLQAAAGGHVDNVTGTLMGSQIGAHQVAAIAIIGATWLVLDRPRRKATWVCAGLLAAIPILSAANQVVLALPPLLVITALLTGIRLPLRLAGVLTAVFLLLLLAPGLNSEYARATLSQLGGLTKSEPIDAVISDMGANGRILLFGQGPAETVSGSAFYTTVDNPSISALGIDAAEFPQDLKTFSEASSVRRPVSSVVGVLGDLGLVGFAAYVGLVAFVLTRTRRIETPLGQTATAAFVLLLLLGFFNDGLEQPAFAMVAAVFAGLALTRSRPSYSAWQ